MTSENKVIIWVENKLADEQEINDYILKLLSNKGIELICAKDINLFALELDKVKKESIIGFIIDMMLDGPNDLSIFTLPNIKWEHDYEDAGGILLKWVIKSDTSEYK